MQYRSIPYFSEREWSVMTHITGRTLEIALLLLPIFAVVRFAFEHTKGLWSAQPIFKALISALFTAVGLLFLLVTYAQLLEKLDWLTAAIIDGLNHRKSIEALLEQLLIALEDQRGEASAWAINPIPSIITGVKFISIKWGIPVLRAFLHYIRGYLLVFSTQVGPFAIAFSLLPGRCASALRSWFSMHLSILSWGITMALLDLSMAMASYHITPTPGAAVRDWLASLVFKSFYVIVAPLTALYIGHNVGGSLLTQTSGLVRQRMLRFVTPFIPSRVMAMAKMFVR